MNRECPILLLALGNDLLGDDGVGLLAARAVREEFSGQVDVVESGEAGLALVEMLEGYEKAILLDAIVTGKYPPGEVIEFKPEDFSKVIAPSPHYAGLPEVLEMARRLQIDFPSELKILALEVENPYEFNTELTVDVAAALPDYIKRIQETLCQWTSTLYAFQEIRARL